MEVSGTVSQLLQRKGNQVFTVAPDTSVFDALREMAEKNVGALVVVDGERVAGIFSERDYARKIILMGKSSLDTRVGDVMTTQVITVGERDSLQKCMQLMTEKRVRHLPVVEDGKLKGIVSIGDVVKEVISEQALVIEQLQNYISGNNY